MTLAATKQTFTSNERRIIGITSAGHALCHVSELAFGAVILSVMAEFDLSPDRATALMVPGFALYGIGAVPSGLWTDRRGSREVLTTYFLALAVAALAVCFARTAWQVGAALALLGAAISLYHPAGLTMISHVEHRRGRAMGINGVAGSLGVATGPFLGLFLAGHGYWRATYALVAAAALAGGIASLLTPIHLPKAVASKPASNSGTSRKGAVATLSLLFVAMLFGGINYRCLTTALPTYLGEVTRPTEVSSPYDGRPRPSSYDGRPRPSLSRLNSTGGDVHRTKKDTATDGDAHRTKKETATGGDAHRTKTSNSASGLLFVILALGGVGQMIGGHLADRFTPARVYVVAIFMGIPCALVMAHGGSWSVPAAATALIIFMFTQQPLENTMIADATPLRWRSTVYGLKFILAFGFASSGAYLTGWVWTQYGLARVFDVFAGIASVMLLLAILYAFFSRSTTTR